MLPIIEVPDPLLRTVSAPVERVDDELRRLIDGMFKSMYAAPGIGLAAVQVAVPRRLVVIDLSDGPDEASNPRVFINPEILTTSDERSAYNEGCLSIPEMYAEVERPARARLRWLDPDGSTREDDVDGLLATCLQHEVDHLDGVLFIDHLSRLKRQLLLKKLEKNRKAAVL